MIQHRLARAAALVTITLLGLGCRDQVAAPPAPAKAPAGGSAAAEVVAVTPFFYAATGPSGHTAYLLGTMHAGTAAADLPPWVWSRLRAAPTFAMETDLAGAVAEAGRLMRTDGGSLEADLGPTDWATLVRLVGEGPAAMLRGFKPAAAGAQLQARGLPPTPPMDLELHDAAFAAGKRIAFLEAPGVQLDVLEQVLDLDALREMLADPSALETDNRDLLAAYRTGSEAQVLAMLERARGRSKAAGHTDDEIARDEALMLGNRNAAWVPVITGLLAGGDVFVAVGALHLLGPGSVLEGLTKAGLTVRRVTGP
ncbi:MAG: TraB/GumN family protein [Kofleriaceae bacterium]